MKNNFKFLIVLAILLAGCICIGSTFAADSNIDVTDVSVDNTQQNIEIAHDDSSTKNNEINNLQGDDGKITPDLSIGCNDSDIIYGEIVTIAGDFDVNHKEVMVTGTVFLYDNNTIIANKTINNSSDVKFNNLKLAAGIHGFKFVFISNDEIYGDTNSRVITPTVDKATPYANIDIIPEEIIYGDEVTVIVTLPDDATGNVTVFVNGTGYENITLFEGKCNCSISDLAAGVYNITVVYNGDSDYNSSESSVNVTVSPKNIPLNPSLNGTYGSNITGTVDTKGKAGIVSVTINGTVYNATVGPDGLFILNGTDSIDAGYYKDIPISFISDDGNYIGNTLVNFSITRKKINITATVDNIAYGDNLSGSVIADLPGLFDVHPGDGHISYVFYKNGPFTTEWDEECILSPGTYTARVTFISDDWNYQGEVNVTYTISKATSIVTVDPVKGEAGEKVKITVRVTDERGNPVPEGTVIIGFNGKEYKVNVVNGIATVEVVLPNKAGTYYATAYYEGFNYNSSYTTFPVEVSDIPGPNPNPTPVNNGVGNMENTGNPLFVLLVALCAIGLESFRRKF